MSQLRDVQRLVELICPLLAGHSPGVQSAVLADLTAIWLAGHTAFGSTAKTDAMREGLLTQHVELVRMLIPINAGEER